MRVCSPVIAPRTRSLAAILDRLVYIMKMSEKLRRKKREKLLNNQ
jgi:hypothetical protein